MDKEFFELDDKNYVIFNDTKIYLRNPKEVINESKGKIEIGKKRVELVIFPFGRVDNIIIDHVYHTLKNFLKKLKIDIRLKKGETFSLPSWEYRIGTYFKDQGFIDILKKMYGEINFGITEVGVVYNGEKYHPRFGIGSNGVGIQSTYRFKSEINDFEKYKWRIGKEAIKIVSLAYGMKHCKNNLCLLRFHPTIQSLDRGPNVCEECKKKYIEIVEQYHRLYNSIINESKQKSSLYGW